MTQHDMQLVFLEKLPPGIVLRADGLYHIEMQEDGTPTQTRLCGYLRPTARKKAQGLCRANVWIPMDQNEYFQDLAAEARARHFSRLYPQLKTRHRPQRSAALSGNPRAMADRGSFRFDAIFQTTGRCVLE
jgi:hypothetical protein